VFGGYLLPLFLSGKFFFSIASVCFCSDSLRNLSEGF